MKMVKTLLVAFWTFAALELVASQNGGGGGGGWSQTDPSACNADVCRLPRCFCAGTDAPMSMQPSVIPQIVMFTFDDAVNEQVIEFYNELFPVERVNPNGCPVTATFFVSHNWTDYAMVAQLYERGHEIASHSITHRMPQSWWRYASVDEWRTEIAGQRRSIIKEADLPRGAVTGMRAPFLDTGGDNQFTMLVNNGFEYDASFMTGPHDGGGAWPFTMDAVANWNYCSNLNCPQARHPGLWQVPLNRWVGVDGLACSMVDSCQTQPTHKGETLSYLWQNFNRHYYGNRAPVGVNMHATWLQTAHHYDAMKEFVKTISEMDDVYLLTVQQTLAWMKQPKTQDRAKAFRPWRTACDVLQKGGLSVNDVAQPAGNRRPETNSVLNEFEMVETPSVGDAAFENIENDNGFYAGADRGDDALFVPDLSDDGSYPDEFYDVIRFTDLISQRNQRGNNVRDREGADSARAAGVDVQRFPGSGIVRETGDDVRVQNSLNNDKNPIHFEQTVSLVQSMNKNVYEEDDDVEDDGADDSDDDDDDDDDVDDDDDDAVKQGVTAPVANRTRQYNTARNALRPLRNNGQANVVRRPGQSRPEGGQVPPRQQQLARRRNAANHLAASRALLHVMTSTVLAALMLL